MTIRAAILVDLDDSRLGRVMVPDTTFVIRHNGSTFVRTDEGIRVTRQPGGHVAAIFRQTEIYVRDRLEPL